jgi:VIT1/CCC1 family predicted Fe2+/Mn2+ transporter
LAEILAEIDSTLIKKVISFQRSEITENKIYSKLSAASRSPKNKKVLSHIAEDELRHYNFWKKYTHQDLKPDVFQVWFYYLISRIFGLTFGVKLMERGEKGSQHNYSEFSKFIPEVKPILKDEHAHEQQLIALLQEDKLRYIGSIVLGLNDALVELTGALAGLTFALSSGRVVALAGLITGIAASLSMAASEYQSRRTDKEAFKEAFRASIYTGIAYIITVLLLVLPYLLLSDAFVALGCTLGIALIIIFLFTFYTAIAQELPFYKRFLEMALISLGVATISFGIGVLVKAWLGVAG